QAVALDNNTVINSFSGTGVFVGAYGFTNSPVWQSVSVLNNTILSSENNGLRIIAAARSGSTLFQAVSVGHNTVLRAGLPGVGMIVDAKASPLSGAFQQAVGITNNPVATAGGNGISVGTLLSSAVGTNTETLSIVGNQIGDVFSQIGSDGIQVHTGVFG